MVGWLIATALLWVLFFYIFWQCHARWAQAAEFAREWRTYASDARDHIQLLETHLKVTPDLTETGKHTVMFLLKHDLTTIELSNKRATKWEERVPKWLRKRYVY
jgi:hypothetical protein